MSFQEESMGFFYTLHKKRKKILALPSFVFYDLKSKVLGSEFICFLENVVGRT